MEVCELLPLFVFLKVERKRVGRPQRVCGGAFGNCGNEGNGAAFVTLRQEAEFGNEVKLLLNSHQGVRFNGVDVGNVRAPRGMVAAPAVGGYKLLTCAFNLLDAVAESRKALLALFCLASNEKVAAPSEMPPELL